MLSLSKRPLPMNVLQAAYERIMFVFSKFPRVYVSFSGGKDSTVLVHLVADCAMRLGRKFGVMFVDLEAQYKMTIQHVTEIMAGYGHLIDPHWVALPLNLRNAVSVYEPQWTCWDPDRQDDWVRQPPRYAITDESHYPFFRRGMEFEQFTPAFGQWYGDGRQTACLVGIRSDESLNRFRTLINRKKRRYAGLCWTTQIGRGGRLYNAYPIYDWRTADIWTFCGKFNRPNNRLYDLMAKAGLTIHQQRICQPYGDDQRKGLWLYQIIEPETWGRVVARVNGANSGSLYSQEAGNIQGVRKITLPDGHTWKSFAHLLLDTMPHDTAEHYRAKIAVFLKWWETRDYPKDIPDFVNPQIEAAKKAPSWRRVCKALLKNDYWCKSLSFSQQKPESIGQYRDLMRRRRAKWQLI